MSRSHRKVRLSEGLRVRLAGATVGTGGYQTLVQEIRKRLEGATVIVDDALVERIAHYAFDYGTGGWQQLLRDLLSEIESSSARS